MGAYRLYFIDDNDRIGRIEEFKAEDDAAAIIQVRRAGYPGAVELWSTSRWVQSFAKPLEIPTATPEPSPEPPDPHAP